MSKQADTVYIKPDPTFRWYPGLREQWGGALTLRGAYHAGDPLRESVVTNADGDSMAIDTSNLTRVKPR